MPLCNLGEGSGFFTVRDTSLSEYAALGFEYGYSVESSHPGRLGGAVRRLRQRSRDHHRQLPRRRRGQVGPAVLAGHAAASRLRGTRTRALQRTHRAVLVAERAQQPARGPAVHRGPVLPPAARPGHAPARVAPHRLHPQVPPARDVDPLAAGRLRVGVLPARAGRRGRRPRGGDASRVRHRQGRARGPGAPRRDRRLVGRGRARGADLPLAPRRARRPDRLLPERARGRVAPGGAREHGGVALRAPPGAPQPARPPRSATSRAPSPPARRPAARWCTPPSSPTYCAGRSGERGARRSALGRRRRVQPGHRGPHRSPT